VQKSKSAFKQLQLEGYIRYEDMPLETKDGRHIDVEFVSNVYRENGHEVIQCNIRDITERKHAEVERAILETIEQEQRRIGQDLHDGLCQQLTGVALIAVALAKKLSVTAVAEAAEASEITNLINQAITETHGLAKGLAPVEIEAAGLVSALYNLSFAIQKRYKIPCVFISDDSAKLQCKYEPFLALHLYRIAQEAINNAIQHGKAKHLMISLKSVNHGEGKLTIKDDGCGYKRSDTAGQGMGIRGMRYRSKMINAHFDISKKSKEGTIITCLFPLENKKSNRKNEKKH
jgi:signal transduction histidine kinase